MFDSAVIEIDGKSYTLRFPLKELIRAESLLNKSLQTIFMPKQVQDGKVVFPDMSLRDLTILFKIGLRAEHSKITEQQAEDLLTQFLSTGQSLAAQEYALYLILGKAAGFFRVETDFQKEIQEKLSQA